MAYPEPLNLTTVPLLLDYANTVTDSWFGVGILFSLYSVVLIGLIVRGHSFSKSIVASSALTTVPAILFFLMGLLSNAQLAIFVSVFIAGLLYSYLS